MKNNKYLELFQATFTISMFTFGGGYVIVSLLQKKFCEELHWIEEEEMLNLAAIAQSSPGAVAVNAAIVVGYRIGGIAGAMISVLGTIIPPFVIISIISLCYTAFRDNMLVAAVLKGMQSGVAAVIADVVMNLSSSIYRENGWFSVVVMGGAFLASWYFSVNVVWIILACGVYGLVRTGLRGAKAAEWTKENEK
jgi:chromate transporter